MNPLAVSALSSLIIWLLTFGSGWLVNHGVWTKADATTYVSAAAMGIISLAWAQRNVIRNYVKVLVALMPGIHTMDQVNAHIADKLPTPALLTPSSTSPGVPKVGAVLLACAVAVGSLSACGGGARHVAVVADQTAYETFADLHALEQTALCGLPSCATSTAVEHEKGWTLAKSQAFNKKLLPAVRAGQQFNQLLAGWKPGTPVPQAVTDGVGALGTALAAVVADFPPGTTKDKILANIGRAQGLFLNAFQIILTVKSS